MHPDIRALYRYRYFLLYTECSLCVEIRLLFSGIGVRRDELQKPPLCQKGSLIQEAQAQKISQFRTLEGYDDMSRVRVRKLPLRPAAPLRR